MQFYKNKTVVMLNKNAQLVYLYQKSRTKYKNANFIIISK